MELIAAVDRRWGLGRKGQLLYHIPADLERFRKLTLGRTIVYGRRTMATFPQGLPLPDRENLVVTHHPETLPPGCRGISDLDQLAELEGETPLLLVGGASLYDALLDHCTRAFLTRVEADGGADVFLRNLDRDPHWCLRESSPPWQWDGLTFSFLEYLRIQRSVSILSPCGVLT